MQFCFQEQQPHVCIYQCPTFSTLSLDQQVLQHFCSSALLRQGRPTCAAPWVALCCTCWVSFQAEGPLPCLHAMVPSCFSWIYLQEGWLRICYSALKVSQRTQVEVSPAIHIQGKHSNGTHQFLWSGLFPRFLKSSHGSPTFCMQKLSSWLTGRFRKICSKYRCSIDVFLW